MRSRTEPSSRAGQPSVIRTQLHEASSRLMSFPGSRSCTVALIWRLSGDLEEGRQSRIVVAPVPCEEEFDGSHRLHLDRSKNDALEAQICGGLGNEGGAEPGPDQGEDRGDL